MTETRDSTDAARRTAEEIGRKARRKVEARQRRDENVWFGLGLFGLVGWAVAIPTLLGVGLGIWIDRHTDSRVSWTLTLLLAGVAVGCLNAWYWVSRESRGD